MDTSRDLYTHRAKWTVAILGMVLMVLVFVFLEVTLLSSQSTGDHLVAQLKTEHASDEAHITEFTTVVTGLESVITNLEASAEKSAANQAAQSRWEAAETARFGRLVNFVRTHPGRPIPSNLLVPVPRPTLQKTTADPLKGSSKSVSKAAKRSKHKPRK